MMTRVMFKQAHRRGMYSLLTMLVPVYHVVNDSNQPHHTTHLFQQLDVVLPQQYIQQYIQQHQEAQHSTNRCSSQSCAFYA